MAQIAAVFDVLRDMESVGLHTPLSDIVATMKDGSTSVPSEIPSIADSSVGSTWVWVQKRSGKGKRILTLHTNTMIYT
jgi:hypothetical protein